MISEATEFQGRPVAVLGAASGIGRATALAFAAKGARVAALDVNTDPLEGFADDLRTAGAEEALSAVADVRDSNMLNTALKQATDDLGGLDHLIFTSGILRVGALADMAENEFDDVFAVNMRGFWIAARAALPHLQAGPDRRKSITALSSAAAIRPKASSGAYAASKIALSHLVRVLAVEQASSGITVNAIAPATVDTPMTQPFMGETNASHGYRLSGTSPMGRIAQPEDIAEACLFLSSQASSYITGITMPVDGGSTAAMPRG
ncbi:MAG: SDR family oxidoreductase [Alphaproteobacteria bacterium]|nr:SDR family oxidoreductase [Alphaproteobacteria bacterium]